MTRPYSGMAVVGAVAVAVVTAMVVLAATGGLAVGPAFADPGAAVRWGLPVTRTLRDVTAALTIGLLVLAAVVLPAPSQAWPAAVRAAAIAGVVWTMSTVSLMVLTYADIAGLSPLEPGFGEQLGFFVSEIPIGRGLLATAVVAAVVSTAAFGITSINAAGALSLVALGGLLPLALAGHAAGSPDHESAVTSLGLHLVGVSVWFGGLAGLALVGSRLGDALGPAARRLSALAGVAFALVALSGVVNAWLNVGGPSGLVSGYGALVVAKTAALALLGAAGWAHRRWLLGRIHRADAAGRRAFWRLVAGELVVLGAASGLAVALSRTPPPVPDVRPVDPTPAELLTGQPLPPPLTPLRWLTEWRPDLLWVLVAVAAAGCYLAGVARLRRRGDRWPVHRTVLWLAGCLVLLLVTSAGPATYGRVLFSAHMLSHMTLSMVVPPLLVVGAPVTLALRTLGRRQDGSRGPREWLLVVVHSRALRLLGHPLVAASLFAGSLVVFYYSPLFGLALRTHVGHELMTAHFLGVGYLFASVLIGIDPGPRRPPYPLLLLLLFATMAFHAFFGVALVGGEVLLAGEWFQALGRDWGRPLLEDQQYGGALAWGIGEIPTLALALVVAVQWSREDRRESRRSDRAADRDHDAELNAYNAYLSGLAERSSRRRG